MSKYCNHCMAPMGTEETKCPVCGKESTAAVPAHHLLPGTVLNGKFYVGKALGEGGFGITYIGRDIKLDMKVAIKEFYPNGYVNRSNTISPQVNDSVTEDRRDFFEKGRERFLKEAQILAKFSGEPGVVDVRDFFEENNTAYIIMEYLDGVDLKTYLKNKGTLTPEHTIQLLMPVMNSLKKVHAQGLIHRDISPDNIMVIGDKVKLLDFGAARTVSAEANKSLSVMLKPGYAPEEQYRSKGNQGPWTDIYALCATMYKCITGITPDDATQRVFSDEVKAPSAMNVQIKPEIEKAIMRGMSVHQTDRYQSVEDLIRGLQGIEVAVSASNQTVAAGKNVVNDDAATMYVPAGADDRTVLGERVTMAAPATNAPATAEKPAPAPVPPKPVQPKPVEPKPAQPKPVQPKPVEPKPVSNENTQPEKKKSNAVIIAIVAVVIAALIGLVVYLLVSKGDDGDSKKNSGNSKDSISAEDEDDETKASDGTGSANGGNVPGATEPTNPDNTATQVEMSDNLFDFTFELEGVVYKLPCKYTDFTKNGWTISSTGISSDTKISGDSYKYVEMAKDGREITVYVYNMSGNVKTVKDCKIGGIECNAYYNVSFTIAKGITVNSTVEEIKTAFGVPGYTYTGTESETLKYYAQKDSTYNSVEFYCTTDGTYSTITMQNFIATADDQTTTNTERPAYLDQYKAPTAMGSDLKSCAVKIEGELYQLPCPVSAFANNGWEIIQQSGDVIAGGTDFIRMAKNGKELDLYIVNFAEYQTTVSNCAVYKVYVDEYDTVSIRVGPETSGIKIGASKATVDAQVTSDVSFYDGTYSYSYTISEYTSTRDFSMTIYVSKETEKVTSISVSCKTWKYTN